MTQSISVTLLTIGLAALLGFAAQRANICTVRAVKEMLTTRRAYMLLSFGKTVLWVILATCVFGMMLPETTVYYRSLSIFSVVGGFLFGIGATLNGGCAISTLTNLASGRLSMLFSIMGMAVGATGFFLYGSRPPMQSLSIPPTMPAYAEMLSELVVFILSLWALWEVYRIWRGQDASLSIAERLLAKHYRLSTAALLIGISNAILLVFYGPWSFTSGINQFILQQLGMGMEFHWIYGALVVSVLGGIATSALLRGKFHLRWRPNLRWLTRFAGGGLMGFGAAMVPGGNDELIFSGIPSLSASALVAYAALIAGIAVSLKIAERIGQKIERVDCGGDVYRSK